MKRHNSIRRRQRGAVSLLIAMLVLFAATLLLLYTGKTAVLELTMSANDVRERQALAEAQAGVDQALSRLGISDCNNDGTANDPCDVVGSQDLNGEIGTANGSYHATYCDPSLAVSYFASNALCPSTPAAPSCTSVTDSDVKGAWVVSCGWSDDNSARKRIVSYIGRNEPLPNAPTNPLISRGAAAVGSSITVMNYYTNLTVWSGSSASFSGGSSKTFIRSPEVSSSTVYDSGELIGAGYFNLPSSTCSATTGTSNSCGNKDLDNTVSCLDSSWICTSSNTIGAPDVVANDTSLSRLSSEDFFANFFGSIPSDYKLNADVTATTTSEFSALDGTTSQVIWVQLSDGADLSLPSITLGTEENPVILIVDGNISGANANFRLFGTLYATGSINLTGGAKIFGAVVGNNTFGGSGGSAVIYDPVALANINKTMSQWVAVPGGWRDW